MIHIIINLNDILINFDYYYDGFYSVDLKINKCLNASLLLSSFEVLCILISLFAEKVMCLECLN